MLQEIITARRIWTEYHRSFFDMNQSTFDVPVWSSLPEFNLVVDGPAEVENKAVDVERATLYRTTGFCFVEYKEVRVVTEVDKNVDAVIRASNFTLQQFQFQLPENAHIGDYRPYFVFQDWVLRMGYTQVGPGFAHEIWGYPVESGNPVNDLPYMLMTDVGMFQ